MFSCEYLSYESSCIIMKVIKQKMILCRKKRFDNVKDISEKFFQ